MLEIQVCIKIGLKLHCYKRKSIRSENAISHTFEEIPLLFISGLTLLSGFGRLRKFSGEGICKKYLPDYVPKCT